MVHATRIPGGGALAFALLAAAVLLAPSTRAAAGAASCSEKPYVVMIHADWCGSCRALGPTWDRIRSEFGDAATIVKFDVTDRASFEEARAEAKRLGIEDFFHEYRSRTGTVAVFDCETREPVAVVNGDRDIATYREAIERATRSS